MGLSSSQRRRVRNTVWLTADVHDCAAPTARRWRHGAPDRSGRATR